MYHLICLPLDGVGIFCIGEVYNMSIYAKTVNLALIIQFYDLLYSQRRDPPSDVPGEGMSIIFSYIGREYDYGPF